jgi:vanillate O-demethylase ferredoxin subunit
MTNIALHVTDIKPETPLIRRLGLARVEGGPLPGFTAGAHITLDVPGVGSRKYSLVHAAADLTATRAPLQYVLGVRLDAEGGGGSRYIHALCVGDTIHAEPPQNNFALKPGPAPVALVGGGIGVTPLIAMAATLRAEGRPFRMAYAARSRSELAFMPEIEALAGDVLTIHSDDTAGRVFDMAAHFAALPAGTQVYMCGPKPMLKAGMDAARKLGWPRDRLAFELFYSVAAPQPQPPAPPPPVADGSFEVVLKSSGKSFQIPGDRSILDVLIEAGVDPIHDCKRGECGVCQVGVVEGVPDHKDHILSDGERASNKVMQICVSRSKSPRLVLDM